MSAAVIHPGTKEGMTVSPIKLVAIFTALLSLCMISLGSDMERSAIARIIAQAQPPTGPSTLVQHLDDAKEAQIGIIRNNFLMFVIAGGSFAGAITSMCLRWAYAKTNKITLPSTMLGAYFTVSWLSSFFCSPAILKKWFSETPEDCLAYSFLVAMGAWAGWEVISIIADRCKKAAQRYGWAGVAGEITGRPKDEESAPTKPTTPTT